MSSAASQNTLKFTAYPNKCAHSEIYIYVMSIALTLASDQETSDSRGLILNNLNITSRKGSANILGWKHLIQTESWRRNSNSIWGEKRKISQERSERN